MTAQTGTNAGPELLVELDRSGRTPLRAQLEEALREATRSGRLRAGTRLPASRALASDLDVSRRLVVDAYAQLLAEGYLLARR
ncbi:MAG TPA: GntR family transcriptional regulator, partial [Solirubrobacteraceae bacterium]